MKATGAIQLLEQFKRDRVHASLIDIAQRRILRLQHRRDLRGHSSGVIAAFALYMTAIQEGVDYSMREVSNMCGVKQKYVYRVCCNFEDEGDRLAVHPANLVERLVYNEFPELTFANIKAIRRIINADFNDVQLTQSLSPRTIVGAAIYLHCRQTLPAIQRKKITLRRVAQSCSINEKSIYSLLGKLKKPKRVHFRERPSTVKRGEPIGLAKKGIKKEEAPVTTSSDANQTCNQQHDYSHEPGNA